ncbi:MAG TPA: peptidase U32 family protein, partial [Spirochaetia bacterium]|nr:peptidase U32 family protein [Spirochaetia bacterium]
MTTTLPELLLPAGGFESGIAALEGGADALYLGFSEFSARRQARNFGREEYRRLLRLARSSGKKIHVAVNTVILESELEGAAGLLAFLGEFPPDALIIQDWGLVALVRERFPGLAVHASTQTAAQGPGAARLALERGATRLVLPRECGLAELRLLHEALPELEYEVFVHGALCYSFSGLCLASGRLLGRSGNRGECAQVCRSYYRAESGPGMAGRTGYWFSCKDLNLEADLSALVEAGAASLKVEGRMKSPEYAYAVARLYRGALDRLADLPGAPSEAELEARREEARLAFSRSPTRGYLKASSGENLLDADYPGHRGLPGAKVVAAKEGRATLELKAPLGLRDGLLSLSGPAPMEAKAFSVGELRDAATGRFLVHARSGGLVEIGAPPGLAVGQELERVSAREFDRRTPSPEEYPPALLALRGRLFFEAVEPEETDGPVGSAASQGAPASNAAASSQGAPASGAAARLALDLELPRFDALPGRGSSLLLVDEEALPLEKGKNPGGFSKALALFAESGEAPFRLELSFAEGAGAQLGDAFVPLADLFVPPSLLKKAKNRLYARAEEALALAEEAYAARAAAEAGSAPGAQGASDRAGLAATIALDAMPPRSLLVFPHPELPSGLPFATPRVLAEGL